MSALHARRVPRCWERPRRRSKADTVAARPPDSCPACKQKQGGFSFECNDS